MIELRRCPMCGGSGMYTDIGIMYIKCKACNGTGKVDFELKGNSNVNTCANPEDQDVVVKKMSKPTGVKINHDRRE